MLQQTESGGHLTFSKLTTVPTPELPYCPGYKLRHQSTARTTARHIPDLGQLGDTLVESKHFCSSSMEIETLKGVLNKGVSMNILLQETPAAWSFVVTAKYLCRTLDFEVHTGRMRRWNSPALLIRMSIPPKASTVALTHFPGKSSAVTSPETAIACPPALRISSATCHKTYLVTNGCKMRPGFSACHIILFRQGHNSRQVQYPAQSQQKMQSTS
jgi:hypothetical protein